MATFSNYANWGAADTTVGFKVINSAPLDRRFVVDTFSNISKVVPKAYRYPGLRIYVLDEEKEYWFKSGVNSSNLVEYHPESMYVVAENAIQDIDTSKLTVGAEITIFDSEGNPTKYVWNGTTWKSLVREVGGNFIAPIITNTTTDTYEELETLINNHVQANDITVSVGTEIPIIFTDTAQQNPNTDILNKYVYLNNSNGGHWYQASGSEVFRFTIPNEILNAEPGTELVVGDGTTSAKYIKFVRGENKRLDIVISHNFCSQFVDASYYQVGGGEPSDKDYDDVLDSDWGEEVFIPADSVKSNGEYKHVLTFFSYDTDEADVGSEFVVLLQR